ncbi:histone chaperone ASF1 [Botrytis cinerea]
MSVVSLLGVNVLNNPAKFGDPYEFEITFECLEALQKDLEWKLTYVGSATSDEHDQELDSLLVGPIPVGTNKFLFQADAPDTKRIPDAEILGVTVILLTCAYDDLVADGEEYGAEEAGEDEDEEVEGEESGAVDPDAMEQDSEMAGAEAEGAAAEETGDESEDLEAESSGESDEEGEEEEGAGDDDMEMDGVEKPISDKTGGVTHQVDVVMAA